MRTVFFGSPAAALPSLEALLSAGHSVELVVTQPDKPAGRGRRLTASPVKAFALERGLPVIEPARIRADEAARARIEAAGAEINIVVAYGQIIPRAIHWAPPRHSLNVHFSLLPKYRGAAPVQWTVLNGDAESGVTIIELNDRMDEGDILAQERVEIRPRETAAALGSRLAVLGARLLVETLAGLDRLTPRKQDDTLTTLAPKIRKEDGRITWADTAAAIDRKVLALADRPGVFTVLQGRRVGILKGRALGPEGNEAAPSSGGASAEPGTIAGVDKTGLEVVCGDGTRFLIEELQPEGKGAMSAHAFTLGTKLGPGVRFGS